MIVKEIKLVEILSIRTKETDYINPLKLHQSFYRCAKLLIFHSV